MDLQKSLKKFDSYYHDHQNLYEELSHYQNPDVLMIACCDSRVLMERVFDIHPGQVFSVRNIANIVPPFGQSVEYASTTSAIEYAVQVLKVKDIVVCAHSNCGGCRAALQDDEELKDLPYTKKWVELLHPIRDHILEIAPDADVFEQSFLIEQSNAVESVRRLMDYPFISSRVEKGELDLHAWHYNIGDGKIAQYNKEIHIFEEFTNDEFTEEFEELIEDSQSK